jgi:hypothetical protein
MNSINKAAYDAAIKAYNETPRTNDGEHSPMRNALNAALPHLVAQQNTEIERLKIEYTKHADEEVRLALLCNQCAAEIERLKTVSTETALDHLGTVLYVLADLCPNDRCKALNDAQDYYNSTRTTQQISPNPGWVTRLVQVGPLDWPIIQ